MPTKTNSTPTKSKTSRRTTSKSGEEVVEGMDMEHLASQDPPKTRGRKKKTPTSSDTDGESGAESSPVSSSDTELATETPAKQPKTTRTRKTSSKTTEAKATSTTKTTKATKETASKTKTAQTKVGLLESSNDANADSASSSPTLENDESSKSEANLKPISDAELQSMDIHSSEIPAKLDFNPYAQFAERSVSVADYDTDEEPAFDPELEELEELSSNTPTASSAFQAGQGFVINQKDESTLELTPEDTETTSDSVVVSGDASVVVSDATSGITSGTTSKTNPVTDSSTPPAPVGEVIESPVPASSQTKRSYNHFVHLKVHSEFSIKTGLMKTKQIVEKAVENGSPAVCVSDLNMFSGLIKLFNLAKEKDIRPICALELNIKDENEVTWEVTLYALNTEGYFNMSRILTRAYNRTYGKDRDLAAKRKDEKMYVPIEDLGTYSEGVACLVGSYYGPIAQYARKGQLAGADAIYIQLQDIYGQHLFQAIARCDRPGESQLEPYILRKSVELNLPLVAVNDVLFAKRSDYIVHKLRVCIANGVTMDEYAPNFTEEQYYKSSTEMARLFADLPQAIRNTFLLAGICKLQLTLGKSDLPRFHLDVSNPKEAALKEEFLAYQQEHPQADEEEWLLDTLSYRGLEERLEILYPDEKEREKQRPIYVERLEYELGIIKSMKFPGYFLIVQEFIN